MVRSQSMVWSSVFSKERGGDLGLRPGSRKERAERRERERAEREREPYMTTLPHHRSHIAYSDHPRQHPLAISHGGWRGRASEASGRSRLQRSSATQVQERARERGLIYRAARWGGTRQQIADRRRSVGGAIGHCSVAQSRACGGVRAWFGLAGRLPLGPSFSTPAPSSGSFPAPPCPELPHLEPPLSMEMSLDSSTEDRELCDDDFAKLETLAKYARRLVESTLYPSLRRAQEPFVRDRPRDPH